MLRDKAKRTVTGVPAPRCPVEVDPSAVLGSPRACRPQKSPGPSVKDKEQYEALRDEGASKEKAARIANASANSSRSNTGRKGGQAGPYEDRTKDDLEKRAAEIGIEGRSKMSKDELVKALRDH